MRIAVSLVLLYLIVTPTHAGILEVIAGREGVSGTFLQRIESAEGQEIERSRGDFKLMKPHYLFWNITHPDRQLLLAKDHLLTQIDWDLEVVVERTLNEQERGPLAWLMASREALERVFLVDESDPDVVTLRSRDLEASVREVVIAIPEAALWEITVIDAAEQRIEIALTINEDTVPSLADFALPETDFVGTRPQVAPDDPR